MKRQFLLVILSIGFYFPINAQPDMPIFNTKQLTLLIPACLPGIMIDSSTQLRNDTIVYNLKGQIFDNDGFKIKYDKKFISLTTPWETIYEMANAYATKNRKTILELYADNSQEKVKSILFGNQSAYFLDFVSKASGSNLRILGGVQYKEGFMVYTKDDTFGIHANYLVKQNKIYKLSALDDDLPISWNIGLYFKFNPKPIIPLNGLVIRDSLQLSDSIRLSVMLPNENSWIALYYGAPGEPISLLIQDNSANDLNPEKNLVTFYLHGDAFISEGNYTFYISSFNYPIQRISQNFLIDQAKYNINIY